MVKKCTLFLLFAFICSLGIPYVYALEEELNVIENEEIEKVEELKEEELEKIVEESIVEENNEDNTIDNEDEEISISNKVIKDNTTRSDTTGIKAPTPTRATTSYFEQVTNYTGKKVWEDEDDFEEIRPSNIEIVLLANGEETSYEPTWTKNGNEWTYTFKDLPVFNTSTGEIISYSVNEKNVPTGYNLDKNIKNTEYELIEGSFDGSAFIKYPSCSNKNFNLSKSSVDLYFFVVKKGHNFYIWTPRVITNSEKNAIFTEIEKSGLMNEFKESRAEFYAGFGRFNVESGGYFEVTKTDDTTATLTYDNPSTWSYWGEATLKTDEHIKYNPGTTTLKNTHEIEYTEATVTKKWEDKDDQDGIRPTSIVMTLSNGDTVTLSEDNNWTGTINHLPKYNKGKEISYTWTETVPKGYEKIKTEVTGTVTTITNEHIPEETSATVTKKWEDKDNQDGIRPTSIVMTLSNGDTVTLSEDNDWTGTINHLPKYNKGKEISYTWTETVPKGYEKIKTEVNGTVTTITNEHIPEVKDIIVTKVWDDDDDANGVRPESVTIRLIVNDDELESVELNDSNGWTYIFEKYDVYYKGEEIEYKITEDEVNLYKSNVDKSENGFVVTNTYDAPTGDEEEPNEEEDSNPHTADHISSYIRTLFMSVVTLINCSYFIIKKN